MERTRNETIKEYSRKSQKFLLRDFQANGNLSARRYGSDFADKLRRNARQVYRIFARQIAESAGARRRYVDRLAVALDPVHARHAARYEAALRERNRLLGDEQEPDPRWLDAIELQRAEAGAAVAQARERLKAFLCDYVEFTAGRAR